MIRNPLRTTLSVAAGLGVLGASSTALALDCATLPNPVYVSATSLVKPYFAKVAASLVTAPTTPMTVIYQSKSTCAAYSQVSPGANMTGTAIYWTGAGEQSCDLPQPAGQAPELAFGDLTWKTCFNAERPADVSALQTFVQPVGFVVPLSSSQVAITAEECNTLFRFGASAGKQIAPWSDPASIVIRNPNSSTQWLSGLGCGVPGNQFSSNLINGNKVSADVLAKVAAENSGPNAEKTVGILATDYYDNVRDKVKMLAFQSYKQGCSGAFLPDSSATSFDKKNVRDGHYGIFGYTWAMLKTNGGQPVSARGKALVDFMAGTEKINLADPIADAAKAGLVPTCAMSVRRNSDGGDLESFAPEKPCGCAFEAAVGTTTCEACPAGTCGGGKVCRFGYCEAK